MSKEKQIESTDWLIRGISKEQLEREKQEAIMSADLAMCHTEFATGVGEIYTDYDTTAQKMFAIGYRKQSEWISVEERLPEDVYGKDRTKITVLVCSESGRVSTASRQRQFKFNSTKLEWEKLDTFAWSNSKRVTHWMPLPEAPKGGVE